VTGSRPVIWSELADAGLRRLVPDASLQSARSAIALRLSLGRQTPRKRLTAAPGRDLFVCVIYAGLHLRIVFEDGDTIIILAVGRQEPPDDD
jgi:hypothetical protein